MAKLSKRQKKKITKFASQNIWIVIILIMCILAFMVFAYFQGWLDKYFKKPDGDTLNTAGGYVTRVDTLKDIQVNFLDVGQGDCMIIQLPDGKNMIIDSGQYSKAKNAIQSFTTENRITTFDYLLLTHSDRDHVDNMSWVIDTYDIKYIFRPNNYSDNDLSKDLPSDFNTKTEGGYVATSKVYAQFMVSAYNEKCNVEVFNKDSDFTNTIIYNDTEYKYTFDFLTPTADKDKIAYSDANNYSPVMMLEYMGKRIMFTGDAEEKNLGEYVSTYGSKNNVDVLKVGHHGSKNATTSEFIQAIDPEYAVIQCGLNNSYGHPEKETLDILTGYDSNILIYRNDTNGAITLNLGSTINFSMENTDMSNNLIPGQKSKTITTNYSDYYYNRMSLVA